MTFCADLELNTVSGDGGALPHQGSLTPMNPGKIGVFAVY